MVDSFLNHPRPLILVHRALGFDRPENTLEAVCAAVKAGFNYIETDVQTTRDGVPVLFHDRSLVRIFGLKKRIRDVSFGELMSDELRRIHPVPSLIEILQEHPTVKLNLDLKDSGSVTRVAEVVNETQAWDRVCITSFSDMRLNRFRPFLPLSVPIGMGVARSFFFALAANVAPFHPLARMLASNCQAIHLPVPPRSSFAYRPIIKIAHEEGLSAYAWTINSRSNMERVLDLGFDGLVTDAPQELRDVVASRARRSR